MELFFKADLLEQWVRLCMTLCLAPRELSTADRKIVRNVAFSCVPDDTLTLFHAGYGEGVAQSFKLKQLERYYWNERSRTRALADFEERVARRRFGSVGFSTYGMEKKGFTTETQCIQGISLTVAPGFPTEVDVWYRTTDILKKFAADLVFLRDILLKPFDTISPIARITCHFSNATIDPVSWWLILPHLEDDEIIDLLNAIREVDPRLWKSIITRLRYYLEEREIKFDRFNRHRPFFNRVTSPRTRQLLTNYIKES